METKELTPAASTSLMRQRKVLEAMDEIKNPLAPVNGNSRMFKLSDGRKVQIRTARLTSINKSYGSRQYSYEVWHVNLSGLLHGVTYLLVGLFNPTGTRLQAIKGIKVKRDLKKHTAIVRHRLDVCDDLLYVRKGLL